MPWSWMIILSLQLVLVSLVHCRLDENVVERMIEELSIVDKYLSVTPEGAAKWLKDYNKELLQRRGDEALVEYVYLTRINDENYEKYTEVQVSNMEWSKTKIPEAQRFLESIKKSEFIKESDYRMLKLITESDIVSKNPEVNKKMSHQRAELEKIYGTTKVDGKTLDDMELDIIKGSSAHKLRIWKGWRDAVGPQMRPIFTKFMKNLDIAAKDSGFNDFKEAWIMQSYGYETEHFDETIAALWEEVKPLYKQLHAYVRRKLHDKYGDEIDLKGSIPAHLLGNMWAQEWVNIEADVYPSSNGEKIDVTASLKEKKYTPTKMMELAEAFFVSIGLDNMTDTFWNESMLSRPDWDVQCHASASDLFRDGDVRIKMCANINQDDLITMHHEMGHIEYFMSYAKQPAIFRSGANGGFHEAIGDTIALSVTTQKHFENIGLLPKSTIIDSNNDKPSGTDLNYLMKQALEKIAFLPFGLLIDTYRYDIFTGHINSTNYNSKWWELRESIQGIKSPIPRNETMFDPGAKYHIAANSPYICYFISFIVQFQFYESMCTESGHKGPLYKCDFYGSLKAGDKLKKMLELGQSKPWQDALEKMTKERTYNTKSILEYFKPLQTWLEEQNKGESVGW